MNYKIDKNTYEDSWPNHRLRPGREDVGGREDEGVEETAGADGHEEEVGDAAAAHLEGVLHAEEKQQHLADQG